jgi:Fe-S-cluster-containing dehydrogenase component/DMSO reductase anchor subunit
MSSLLESLEHSELSTGLPSQIADLLREQQLTLERPSLDERQHMGRCSLTAVDQFALAFTDANPTVEAETYRALLPATPPGPGEQYAFEVDLDRCSGCKACVTACHTMNGLDPGETWRSVGLLVGGTAAQPVLQHVTAACHHCLEPACLHVCPTRAYEKDPFTGIVRHLDDQCFGCQYCILACPYDVPKYNVQRGIVRKCDMCSTRLTAGEPPACVQGCPHAAIRITVVQQAEVAADCEANPFLPGAPDPQDTQPTTNYRTSRVFPRNMLSADYYAVHAEHAHWPLIVMLVLTQLSVGAFFVELYLLSGIPPEVLAVIRPHQAMNALLWGGIALAAAVLHLGRPQFAFRAVLGLNSSWLSREIVAFGLFSLVAAAYAAVLWSGRNPPPWQPFFGTTVVLCGAVAVFCSAMIYHVVPRPFWNGPRTLLKFFGTTLWLGCAATLGVSCLVAGFRPDVGVGLVFAELGRPLCQVLLVVAVGKLAYEVALFQHLMERQLTPMKRSARLLMGELAPVTLARFVCGGLGGVLFPAWLWRSGTEFEPVQLVATVVFVGVLSVLGELLERFLFFAAAVAPRMPGGLKT